MNRITFCNRELFTAKCHSIAAEKHLSRQGLHAGNVYLKELFSLEYEGGDITNQAQSKDKSVSGRTPSEKSLVGYADWMC